MPLKTKNILKVNTVQGMDTCSLVNKGMKIHTEEKMGVSQVVSTAVNNWQTPDSTGIVTTGLHMAVPGLAGKIQNFTVSTVTVEFDITNMDNTSYTVYYKDTEYNNPESIEVTAGDTINIKITSLNNHILNSVMIRANNFPLSTTEKNETYATYEYIVPDTNDNITMMLYSSTTPKTCTVNFIKDLTCGFEVEYGSTTVTNPDSLVVNHGENINIKLLTTHNGEFATEPTITYDENTIGFDIDDINYTKNINITKNIDIKIYTDYCLGAYNPDYPYEDFNPKHKDTPDSFSLGSDITLTENNPEYTINLLHYKNLVCGKIVTSTPLDIIIDYIYHGEKNQYTYSPSAGNIYLTNIFNNSINIDEDSLLKITFKSINTVLPAIINIHMIYTTKLNFDLITRKPNNETPIDHKYIMFSLPHDDYTVYLDEYRDIGKTQKINQYNLSSASAIRPNENTYLVLRTTSTNLQYYDVNAFYK